MKKGRHFLEEEIVVISNGVIGKTFRELMNISHIIVENDNFQKGQLGLIIEEALFGIKPTTISGPDFIDAGIETTKIALS